jgi:hypothetical protein
MARANRVFGGSMEIGVKVECITLQGKVIHSNTAYFIIEVRAHNSPPSNIYTA